MVLWDFNKLVLRMIITNPFDNSVILIIYGFDIFRGNSKSSQNHWNYE
jgi:hypothetical protein